MSLLNNTWAHCCQREESNAQKCHWTKICSFHFPTEFSTTPAPACFRDSQIDRHLIPLWIQCHARCDVYWPYFPSSGAFIIPFFIMLIVVGMPLLLLELGLGQKLRVGAAGAWKKVRWIKLTQESREGESRTRYLTCVSYQKYSEDPKRVWLWPDRLFFSGHNWAKYVSDSLKSTL